MIAYRVHLTMDDDGSFLVTSEDFPELTTIGRDRTDAFSQASAALCEAIAARMAANKPIPLPAECKERNLVDLPTLTGLKVGLYRAMLEAGFTRSDLARRMKWRRKRVERLFSLQQETSFADFDTAFQALGKSIQIQIA